MIIKHLFRLFDNSSARFVWMAGEAPEAKDAASANPRGPRGDIDDTIQKYQYSADQLFGKIERPDRPDALQKPDMGDVMSQRGAGRRVREAMTAEAIKGMEAQPIKLAALEKKAVSGGRKVAEFMRKNAGKPYDSEVPPRAQPAEAIVQKAPRKRPATRSGELTSKGARTKVAEVSTEDEKLAQVPVPPPVIKIHDDVVGTYGQNVPPQRRRQK